MVQHKSLKKTIRKSKKKNTNKTVKKRVRKQKGGNIDELNIIVRDESLESLKDYVKQGGDVNKKGSNGVTALMDAVTIADISKVKYLIAQNADVNAVTDDGKTAYLFAEGNDTIIDILKDSGANTDPTYLLLLAIGAENNELAKNMINDNIELGLDLNNSTHYKSIELKDSTIYNVYEYPLLLAIKTDNIEIVEHLLKDEDVSLSMISDKTREDLYNFNNDEDDIIYDDNESAILLAARFSYVDMVDLLLRENAKRDVRDRFDVNQMSTLRNLSPIYVAVNRGDKDVVEKLIDAGANLDSENGEDDDQDNYRDTPLILAARNGNIEMVELLINSGADIRKEGTEGDAVYVAFMYNHYNIVEYFADLGDPGAEVLLEGAMNNEDNFLDSNRITLESLIGRIRPTPIEHKPKDKPIPDILQNIDAEYYDYLDLVDKKIKTFLEEDPKNIIFIYNQQVAGINKDHIKKEITTSREQVMLECKESNFAFHQQESNIVKDDEGNLLYYLYMRLIGLLGVVLPISQLKTLVGSEEVSDIDDLLNMPMDDFPGPFPDLDLSPIYGGNPDARIFVVDVSEDKKTKHALTSFGAYDGDDVTSAWHCAEEESIRIGKLYSVDFPSPKSTTPKSPKKKTQKRTRSKSPKKNTQKRTRSKSR